MNENATTGATWIIHVSLYNHVKGHLIKSPLIVLLLSAL